MDRVSKIDSIITRVLKYLSYVSAICLLVIAVTLVADIICTKVFGRGIERAVDLATYLVVPVVYLGVAHSTLTLGHVKIDIIYLKLPRFCRLVIDFLSELLAAVVSFMLCRFGCKLFIQHMLQHTRSSAGSTTGGVALWPYTLAYVVGCATLGIAFLWKMFKVIWNAKKGTPSGAPAAKEG